MRRRIRAVGWGLLALAVAAVAVIVTVGGFRAHGQAAFNRWVGWATIEEIKMKDGAYQNDRLATYLIPTALDAPRIRTILVENPYSRGPFGAKGIGELPMDGPAPAIIAAIHDATGVWLDEIPATPEKVLAACASS